MEKVRKLRPGTIAMAVFGAAALLLYAWFVSVTFATNEGPGDAVVGQAFEMLTALLLLWGVLIVLIVMDRAMGGPSWTRRAGFFLVPVAAIAVLFASDYPGNRLCQFTIAAMPLLIGAYVLLGRLPARLAARAQAVALLPIAGLSAYAIKLFVS